MKSKYFSRVTALIMSVFVAFSMLAVFTERTEAKTYTDIYPDVLFVGQETNVNVMQWNDKSNSSKEMDVISVTTTNKSLVKITKNSWKENGKIHRIFYLIGKKAGTAKLKITYKKSGGGKATKTFKLKIKKYPNQIKSLKVLGKTVNISENKFMYDSMGYTKTKPVVKMTLKKGWKIESAYGFYYDKKGNHFDVKIKGLKSKILNGKQLSFPSKYRQMQISTRMTNGKNSIEYHVFIHRDN